MYTTEGRIKDSKLAAEIGQGLMGLTSSYAKKDVEGLLEASANIIITYSLICTYFALIFPGLLIHTFYLFSALFAYFRLIRIFLLIPNFLRTHSLAKYIK